MRKYRAPSYVPSIPVKGVGRLDEELIAPHWPYYEEERIKSIRDDMTSRGYCLIRYIRHLGVLRAIEGSHRLWVAHKTRTVVTLQEVEHQHLVQTDHIGTGIITAFEIAKPRCCRGPIASYQLESTI